MNASHDASQIKQTQRKEAKPEDNKGNRKEMMKWRSDCQDGRFVFATLLFEMSLKQL